MSAPTLFAAELRAGRPDAIKRLSRALKQGGSIRAAAKLLEMSPRTLEDWACQGRRSAIDAVLAAVRDWRTGSKKKP